MATFVEEWGNVYNTCIQELTGRNKDQLYRDIPEVAPVISKTGPLMETLVALDKALPDKPDMTKKEDKAGYKIYVAEQQKLNGVAQAYGAFLKAAEGPLKAREATYPAAYRAVKVLMKQVNTIVFRAQNRTAYLSKEIQKAAQKLDEQAQKETEQLRKQGMKDEQIKTEVNWLKQQKMLMLFPTSFRASHAKAEAIVQKVKLKPDKATYNKEMDSARDLTQNMSNVIKAIGDGKCPADLKQEMQGLGNYKAQLDAFGHGAKRSVDDNKTKDQILTQLKEFSALVKAMGPFGDKLIKYLANKR